MLKYRKPTRSAGEALSQCCGSQAERRKERLEIHELDEMALEELITFLLQSYFNIIFFRLTTNQ